MSSTNSLRHVDDAPSWMLPERTRVLSSNGNKNGNCVVYWMQRDVRTVDNWALLYAAYLAQERNVPLRVIYSMPPPSSEGGEMAPFYETLTERYGSFLLGGLEHVHIELSKKKVPFHIIMPHSATEVGSTVLDSLTGWQAHIVVCDHSPLKPYRSWLEDQLVPFCTSSVSVIHVDTHNVVPVWYASPKREIGARTLRPKLNKLLDRFLTEFPCMEGNKHLATSIHLPSFDKDQYIEYLKWDTTVKPVEWAQPGTERAMQQFELFSSVGLKQFHDLRNNPNYKQVCSNLSPWINHGQVSFQRLALQIKPLHKKYANGTAMYMEEGLVRRELSDNFIYYTPEIYDSLESALLWAQETLEVHSSDVRDWLFSTKELEEGRSHDDLWNAAQLQLVREGKLHGFVSEAINW
jgi:deoxyribodipyrimidine photo-lyase